jgi:hypothetical protein
VNHTSWHGFTAPFRVLTTLNGISGWVCWVFLTDSASNVEILCYLLLGSLLHCQHWLQHPFPNPALVLYHIRFQRHAWLEHLRLAIALMLCSCSLTLMRYSASFVLKPLMACRALLKIMLARCVGDSAGK